MKREPPASGIRCHAEVRKRDTYRYHGGKTRFKLHYRRERCTRYAKDRGLCAQHARIATTRTVHEVGWIK